MNNTMKTSFIILFAIILGIALTSCGEGNRESGKAQLNEMKVTEQNQQRLTAAQPAPQLENSLERTQLIQRLQRFNKPDEIAYIYLFSDYGAPITHFPIKGKVSSVNSLLTTPEQVLHFGKSEGESGYHTVVVKSPDLDGSYGSNGDAIFFFRATDDAYMEWNGKYFLSDVPLSLTQKPLLIEGTEGAQQGK